MAKARVFEGGVMSEKKSRPALRKLRILEKMKLATYKPDQHHIDEVLGIKNLLQHIESAQSIRGSKGIRVI